MTHTLQGKLEPADYLAALLLARKHNRLFRIVRAVLWILVVTLGVYYAVVTVADQRYAVRLVVLLAVAGVLVYERIVSLPRRAKRVFREQKSMQDPFEVRFGEDGLEWHSSVSARRLPWNYYSRWAEGPEHFLTFQSDWTFDVLPKRFFEDESQTGEFRRLLETQIGRQG